jgi:hypothetical protein
MSDDVMLACHELRCAWEPSPWYVAQDRFDRRIWKRVMRCLRGCGSTRTDRVRPNGLFEPVGKPIYGRPPGWNDFRGVWFSEAKRRRIFDQANTTGITEEVEVG